MISPWLPRLLLVATALAVGCTAPAAQQTAAPRPSPDQTRPATPKRVTIAVASNFPVLIERFSAGGVGVPGLGDIQRAISPGLTVRDDTGALRPLLAEAGPTLENGLWMLLPDGRMQTTWKIRQGARWHDGRPFTSEDVLFTTRVDQDPEIPMRRSLAYQSIERIEAPDAKTVVVSWKQPYIQADMLFDDSFLPAHLLAARYEEDKAGFTALPFWTEEFVGTGAYAVREFIRGSHMVLRATDTYVLGRPKIDDMDVRFIPDPAALMANVLAGAVELTLGRGISLEQALQVRDQWRQGGIDIAFTSWIVVYPQFINSTPAVVGDLRFRRALLQGVDRGQMAETLQSGLVPVAHTFLHPREPEYPQVESNIVKYGYDPRVAAESIQGMGFTKGADGIFRDAAGQRLAMEIRTSPEQDIQVKTLFTLADYWERLGVATEPVVMAEQRVRDREYVQTFPAFMEYRQPNDPSSLLLRLYGSQTPLPENGFVGRNHPRYVNRDFDALLDRYYTTIPQRQRTAVLGEIVHWTTDNLTMMGLFYDAEPVLISSRLVNVAAAKSSTSSPAWNVDQWDVR
jgi:peptide/nickel transport system substrate-binding protein